MRRNTPWRLLLTVALGLVFSCTGIIGPLGDSADPASTSLPDGGKVATHEQIVPLSYAATYRRAAMLLAGRVPSPAEVALVTDDAQLAEAVRNLCHEEGFYAWLREVWNDTLASQLVDAGVDVHSIGKEYARAPAYYDPTAPGTTDEKRDWAMLSFGEEPLRLVTQIVRDGRPFGEVLTSQRVLVNPYTAAVYGLPHTSPAVPENHDKWEWASGKPMQRANGADVAIPVSGVLGSPAFLLRWPTTLTNKSRKRAEFVLRHFLATDIFRLATRPTDLAAFVSTPNPTRDAPPCAACHNLLDPIAGAFRGWDERVMTHRVPGDPWHPEMRAPGLDSETMPASAQDNAIGWLGWAIVNDKRFGLAMARSVYTGLLGEAPLSPEPADATGDGAALRKAAYEGQQSWLGASAEAFRNGDQDLRELVVRVVQSPYFRAASIAGEGESPDDALGRGRLLTPEMLVRKLRATLGSTDYYWTRPILEPTAYNVRVGWMQSVADPRSQSMLGDPQWRSLLGGGASSQSPDRASNVSTTMFAAWEYIALRVSCNATAFDFTKAKAARRLFPLVDVATRPYQVRASATAPQAAMADNIKAIKANIRELHWRLLGEELSEGSEEETRSYGLFEDTWKELELSSHTAPNASAKLFHYKCAAGRDFDGAPVADGFGGREFPGLTVAASPGEYQPGQGISDDKHFTLRAWQAVITYLVTDYRYLYE